MASGILLRTLYVPSEDNPADEPSRGILKRRRLRGYATKCGKRNGRSEKHPDKKPVMKPLKRHKRPPLTDLERCNPWHDDWRRYAVKLMSRC